MTRRSVLRRLLASSARGVAGADTADFAQRIFARINELRLDSGVEPLAWSEALGRCAREQSARKEQLRFPGHDDPDRGTVAQRVQAAGIAWQRCGENLFSERGWDDPVNFAVVFWWYSAGHRANLLNPDFTESGVGVVKGADETYYITQIFVLPAPFRPRR